MRLQPGVLAGRRKSAAPLNFTLDPHRRFSMKFSVFGPFELPCKNGLIDTDAKSKRTFWDGVDASVYGLAGACGCYIFVVKARRGS